MERGQILEQDICIRDYELNQSIEMLFQLPVYIYGAGGKGQEIECLMTRTGVDIKSFIDKRAGAINRNHDVIDIDAFVKIKPAKDKYIIILALMNNCNILIKELRQREIFTKL